MTITNQGAAGSVIDAETNGDMVLVEGGAIWGPDTGADNSIIGTTTTPPVPEAFEVVARWNRANDSSASHGIVGKQLTAGTDISFVVESYSTALYVIVSPLGTNVDRVVRSITAPATGTMLWYRFVVDPAVGRVAIYTAPDSPTEPTEWTSIYDNTGAAFSMFQSDTSPWSIAGAPGTSSRADGILKYVQVRDNVTKIPAFTFDGDADINDVAATRILTTSGHDLGVVRSATGPVTTIVPAGTSVWVNPDDTVLANRIVYNLDPAWDFDVTEDAVMVFCGQLGQEDGYPFVVNGQEGGRQFSERILTDLVGGRLAQTSVTYSYSIPFDPFEVVVIAAVVDRGAGMLRSVGYNAAGLILKVETPLLDNEDFTVTSTPGNVNSLQLVPGTLSSTAWNVGVGIAPTDDEMAVMAAALLANANRPPTYSTGALPPVGHKVRGDTYTANNGHKAQFNGAQWDAVSPTTGNIAALLGNNQLLLGAS